MHHRARLAVEAKCSCSCIRRLLDNLRGLCRGQLVIWWIIAAAVAIGPAMLHTWSHPTHLIQLETLAQATWQSAVSRHMLCQRVSQTYVILYITFPKTSSVCSRLERLPGSIQNQALSYAVPRACSG